MTRFTASPLSDAEIDRAYPLVQLVAPSVQRRTWQRFAKSRLAGRGRGIFAVRDPKGYILGLASYHKELDLTAGSVLVSDPLLFIDLLKPEDVAMALIAALEDEARHAKCAKVRIFLSQHDAMQWEPGTDLRPPPNLFFMKIVPLVSDLQPVAC